PPQDRHRPCPRPSTGCRWPKQFFVAAGVRLSSRQALTLLLELQIGGLDDIGEDLDVAFDFIAEFLAGTAAGVNRHRLELVAHPRIRPRAPRLRTELRGNRGRRAGRDE